MKTITLVCEVENDVNFWDIVQNPSEALVVFVGYSERDALEDIYEMESKAVMAEVKKEGK
jgi:hypothetical protein